MKVKRLQISFELLAELFREGFHGAGYTVIENAVPVDAKLVNVRHEWPNGIELLIESDAFPEVKDGDVIPDFCPLMRREAA